MAAADGSLRDAGGEDSIAVSFAATMTTQFPALTEKVPEYADLENLFRLRSLTLAMHLRDAPQQAGLDFGSFLPLYRFQDEKPMDPSLPGLANYREWIHKSKVNEREWYEIQLYPMACGGVGMDMQVTDGNFSRHRKSQLDHYRVAALMARPSKDALYWPVPLGAR
jgi:hypothetical protein